MPSKDGKLFFNVVVFRRERGGGLSCGDIFGHFIARIWSSSVLKFEPFSASNLM
jgi:hypothetical protein